MAEKAKSKDQKKFFNIVKDVQQGDIKKDKVTKNVTMVADKMSEKDVDSIASTPSKGLPKKVKQEQFKQLIQKLIKENEEVNPTLIPKQMTEKLFDTYGIVDLLHSLSEFYKRTNEKQSKVVTDKLLRAAIKMTKDW